MRIFFRLPKDSIHHALVELREIEETFRREPRHLKEIEEILEYLNRKLNSGEINSASIGRDVDSIIKSAKKNVADAKSMLDSLANRVNAELRRKQAMQRRRAA